MLLQVITLGDTQSVGLLWTRGRHVAEISTCQHTACTQETDIYATGGIQIRNPNKRVAADPRLRPRGHWDRPTLMRYIMSLFGNELNVFEGHTSTGCFSDIFQIVKQSFQKQVFLLKVVTRRMLCRPAREGPVTVPSLLSLFTGMKHSKNGDS